MTIDRRSFYDRCGQQLADESTRKFLTLYMERFSVFVGKLVGT